MKDHKETAEEKWLIRKKNLLAATSRTDLSNVA